MINRQKLLEAIKLSINNDSNLYIVKMPGTSIYNIWVLNVDIEKIKSFGVHVVYWNEKKESKNYNILSSNDTIQEKYLVIEKSLKKLKINLT